MQDFETVEITTDLLIIGAGMSGSGATVEAAHWAKENNLKVTVVEKAAMERSGAVAMGAFGYKSICWPLQRQQYNHRLSQLRQTGPHGACTG